MCLFSRILACIQIHAIRSRSRLMLTLDLCSKHGGIDVTQCIGKSLCSERQCLCAITLMKGTFEDPLAQASKLPLGKLNGLQPYRCLLSWSGEQRAIAYAQPHYHLNSSTLIRTGSANTARATRPLRSCTQASAEYLRAKSTSVSCILCVERCACGC